ncbi:hypothetical protein ACRAWD_11905 [Caulobacter segnis]
MPFLGNSLWPLLWRRSSEWPRSPLPHYAADGGTDISRSYGVWRNPEELRPPGDQGSRRPAPAASWCGPAPRPRPMRAKSGTDTLIGKPAAAGRLREAQSNASSLKGRVWVPTLRVVPWWARPTSLDLADHARQGLRARQLPVQVTAVDPPRRAVGARSRAPLESRSAPEIAPCASIPA